MKKILILGGKPIGSVEMVQRAREMGLYTVVADYLPAAESMAKAYADEAWDISTAEVDTLVEKCRETGIDGAITAVHEFNINRLRELCSALGFPCYCQGKPWLYCDNKLEFKALCQQAGLPVATLYRVRPDDGSDLSSLPYPVVVKPSDSSGSRGFAVCRNEQELRAAFPNALKFSINGECVVEDYMPYDSVIIHYTMENGKCRYSGLSDKYSAKFASTGASVMGIQLFPSKGEAVFLQQYNERVCRMFEEAGFREGPIWIEAFYDGREQFVFNEMGYRFGGSLTYYPVRYFHRRDQLTALIASAVPGDYAPVELPPATKAHYCILPLHVHAGKIARISGLDAVKARPDVYAYVPVHFEGDEIQDWGSAQQVFCYLHILYDTMEELRCSIREILDTLKAEDAAGSNLVYPLFHVESL